MIKSILSSVFGGSLNTLLKTIFGSRAKRDQYAHTEQQAVQQSFQAEFNHRENRTWWDSLIDGINRLPRPIMTFGVVALFIWAVMDPVDFAASMQALATIPEMLWYILITIIAFWFGTKVIEKAPKNFTPPNPAAVRAVQHGADMDKGGAKENEPSQVVPEQPKKEPPSISKWREANKNNSGGA